MPVTNREKIALLTPYEMRAILGKHGIGHGMGASCIELRGLMLEHIDAELRDEKIEPRLTYRSMELDAHDGYIAEGYATTFGNPYPLYGEWVEVIAPAVLDGADLSDVIFQYDHSGMVMARNRMGGGKPSTLDIGADTHGIAVRADLSLCQQARDLHESISNGLVHKMSWAFTVADEEIDYDKKTRTILRVGKVFDVSAVSQPANDATDISARLFLDGVIGKGRQELLNARKAKLRKRIQIMKELENGQMEGNPGTSRRH